MNTQMDNLDLAAAALNSSAVKSNLSQAKGDSSKNMATVSAVKKHQSKANRRNTLFDKDLHNAGQFADLCKVSNVNKASKKSAILDNDFRFDADRFMWKL